MLHDFNLLITTTRGNEPHALSETWYLLSQIGDPNPQTDKTKIKGLVTAKTTLQPQEAIEKLRNLLKEYPNEFHFTLRIIPIQKTVQTDLAQIREAAAQLAQQIQPNETFRVTIEKRFTNISTKDIIDAVAADVNRKVNLSNPDKIILVEVVGKHTGISILKPTDVISITREKAQT